MSYHFSGATGGQSISASDVEQQSTMSTFVYIFPWRWDLPTHGLDLKAHCFHGLAAREGHPKQQVQDKQTVVFRDRP